MATYKSFTVPVQGGTLQAAMWGERGPLLLGSHGITANHTTFEALVDQLGEGYRVLAVDHRGRGRSNGITGPFGMREHAADLVAVLDHLGERSADLLIGQSMGGFVAAVTAADYPQRIQRVLLVDGGLPLMEKLPWYLPASLFLRLSLGPSMKRLKMSFASLEAYFDYWRVHPALAANWSPYVEKYFAYDLIGEAPAMRSSVSLDAIVADTRSLMGSNLVAASLRQTRCPVRLLRAPRGLLDGKPLYSEALVEKWLAQMPNLSHRTIDDTNHYTILMGAAGAREVAAEVRAMLA